MTPVSVVVASIVGPPFIDDCLDSVQAEARKMGAEVIVVACGADAYAARLRDRFPWVRVIHRPQRETVPQLRRRGVEVAGGEIVAIIEEHCVAAPDWLHQVLAAHGSTSAGAVGGPVADASYRRVRDWVVYFLEYNGSLPPAPAGPVRFLNGANIAYRRQVLIDHLSLLDEGYWEAVLHPVLLTEDVRLLSAPRMVVYHRGPFDLGYYLGQRFWFSRAYAGARSQGMPSGQRLARLATTPVLPLVLLARIGQRVLTKRCHVPEFVRAVPLLIPALAVYAAGEGAGYLLGPGDALTRVE